MKNETITIYELIGLIKDDRAPYEVIYQGTKYYRDELENYYRTKDGTPLFEHIFDTYNDYDALQEKVEFLPEENDEWEDIEDITLNGKDVGYGILKEWLDFAPTDNEQKICSCIETLGIVMNKLIKNQKYLKEKLDKYEKMER